MTEDKLKETPSQTAGPYVHIGTLPATAGLNIRQDETPWNTGLDGERIIVEGMILDGAGDPVLDAMVEIWQADASGKFDRTGHGGFARSMTDFKTGKFRFETVKPGQVPGQDAQMQAPHLTLFVFARGINLHLHTRIYFDDEPDANTTDPVLCMIDEKSVRETLIAQRDPQSNIPAYVFDVVLQGDGETVFFDI